MGKVFKRLLVFLTVFLTSPAFAQADNAHACLNPNANGDCGFIPDGDSTANCGPVPLTFEGNSPNSGTYYLTAQYEQDAYDVYYYRGTCEGDGNPHKYNGVGHYGPTNGYTILPASTSSASQLHGISVPNNMHFVNWSAYWVKCDEASKVLTYYQNQNTEGPAGHYNAANDTADNDNSWNPGTFNWYDENKNCLLLVGNCVNDDSYTVTYKNGTCYDGTAIEWTDPTTTYLNGTYTIPGATNTNITAVYSEGNDKEFTGWKLVWAASGAENNTKDYGDSIIWAHAENLVLEAQCRDKDVHTVTYVANSCETNNNRVVYTNSDIIDGTEYSAYETDSAEATESLNVRDGYTYVGWATKANPTLGSNNQIPVADQWAAGTAVTTNVTLYAICVPIDYKLEYNCGVDPDDPTTAISGTAPSTRTGIHVEDSDVVTAATPTQCNNGLLEFDHWRCVKKDHDTGNDAGVFGTNGEFGAGVSLTNSWPAYDGLCTAVWKQTYSLTFDCQDGTASQTAHTSTRNGLATGTTVNTETGAISTGESMSIPTCNLAANTVRTGWSCNNGAVNVVDDVLTMPSADVTCTPITQSTYVVRYYCDDAAKNQQYYFRNSDPLKTGDSYQWEGASGYPNCCSV